VRAAQDAALVAAMMCQCMAKQHIVSHTIVSMLHKGLQRHYSSGVKIHTSIGLSCVSVTCRIWSKSCRAVYNDRSAHKESMLSIAQEAYEAWSQTLTAIPGLESR